MAMGSEPAKLKILDNHQGDTQKFIDELDLIKKQSRNDTLGHIDDILDAITIALNGFSSTPRKMLVVQMGEYRADLLLVSPPSNDGRMADGS